MSSYCDNTNVRKGLESHSTQCSSHCDRNADGLARFSNVSSAVQYSEVGDGRSHNWGLTCKTGAQYQEVKRGAQRKKMCRRDPYFHLDADGKLRFMTYSTSGVLLLFD
ncbi:hypothetical protein E2C01_001456 [Portunus trituberculatus]|uniref:Uncharacterized protein n=1 Tax=Portunus trituberculatus TaxID=210409 RepID=A0A5B7CJB9_PORTR|nr:hypothetical protein [Portunus trituberculatus]